MPNITSPSSSQFRVVNPSPFRQLNEMERNTIMMAAKKGRIPSTDPKVSYVEDLRVSYERMQGGFTICIITYYNGGAVWRGASRRSYKDARNPVRGEMLAFSRAILYSRPASL